MYRQQTLISLSEECSCYMFSPVPHYMESLYLGLWPTQVIMFFSGLIYSALLQQLQKGHGLCQTLNQKIRSEMALQQSVEPGRKVSSLVRRVLSAHGPARLPDHWLLKLSLLCLCTTAAQVSLLSDSRCPMQHTLDKLTFKLFCCSCSLFHLFFGDRVSQCSYDCQVTHSV